MFTDAKRILINESLIRWKIRFQSNSSGIINQLFVVSLTKTKTNSSKLIFFFNNSCLFYFVNFIHRLEKCDEFISSIDLVALEASVVEIFLWKALNFFPDQGSTLCRTACVSFSNTLNLNTIT